MKVKRVLAIVFLLAVFEGVLGYFLEPENLTAFVGNEALFPCKTNDTPHNPTFKINNKTYVWQTLSDIWKYIRYNLTLLDVKKEHDNTTVQCIFSDIGLISQTATLRVVSGSADQLVGIRTDNSRMCFETKLVTNFPITNLHVQVNFEKPVEHYDCTVKNDITKCIDLSNATASQCEVFSAELSVSLATLVSIQPWTKWYSIDKQHGIYDCTHTKCCREIPSPAPHTEEKKANTGLIAGLSVSLVGITIIGIISVGLVWYFIKQKRCNN